MRVLGISPLHDSSVAVINDGQLEFFLKEERLTGIKRDGPPLKALRKIYDLYEGKIDRVAIASPTFNDPSVPFIVTEINKILKCPISNYNFFHHLSHASLAFYNSGFDESLIFVIDRNGSIFADILREAETVFSASYPCNFNVLQKNFWCEEVGSFSDRKKLDFFSILDKESFEYNADSTMSIVKIYESATTLIGQKPLENGKTMGLASYGEKTDLPNFFQNDRPLDHLFLHNDWIIEGMPSPVFTKIKDTITNNITESNHKVYADYAYHVQTQTQEVALNLIKKWVEKTGIKNVCVTGGYGLNVVANEHYIKNLPDVNFYFEPLADDSGNSIGAALHLYRELTEDTQKYPLTTTFVHGEKNNNNVLGIDCKVEDIANLLNEGKRVGVFNGLSESGPRALGNRSILFDARNAQAKDIVNRIKRREWYRPFAACILENEFQEYFETHGLTKSEFMTVSFQCKKPNDIPGVVHVDGSCRVQTVNDSIPHLFDLLTEFKKITNCPALLNTSFNMAGYPLVETVEEAIEAFETTDLDVLWFPEFNKLVLKG